MKRAVLAGVLTPVLDAFNWIHPKQKRYSIRPQFGTPAVKPDRVFKAHRAGDPLAKVIFLGCAALARGYETSAVRPSAPLERWMTWPVFIEETLQAGQVKSKKRDIFLKRNAVSLSNPGRTGAARAARRLRRWIEAAIRKSTKTKLPKPTGTAPANITPEKLARVYIDAIQEIGIFRCLVCGRAALNPGGRQTRVNCSRKCAFKATATLATRKSRAKAHAAKVKRAVKALRTWDGKGDWKRLVAERSGVSVNWITYAVNRGSLKPPA